MLCQAQIEALKTLYPDVSYAEEGGLSFIDMGWIKLPEGCEPIRVRGLLCPSPRDNYLSRLFLSARVSHKGPGQNWNADGVVILGQRWWAVSWKTTRPNQTLVEIVLDHLAAFRS